MTPPEDHARRRKLDPEERTLWNRVTRSLKPLPRSRAAPSVPRPKPLRSASLAPSPRSAIPNQAPAALDRRLKRRLARGIVSVDGRLDLHGMTQARAHSALLQFLRRAHAEGARFVIVVTGRGTARGDASWEPGRGTGVLRRQVPLWLALPQFHAYVSACEQADAAHGGEGALYIRIRRRA